MLRWVLQPPRYRLPALSAKGLHNASDRSDDCDVTPHEAYQSGYGGDDDEDNDKAPKQNFSSRYAFSIQADVDHLMPRGVVRQRM